MNKRKRPIFWSGAAVVLALTVWTGSPVMAAMASSQGKITVAVTSLGEEKVDPHRFVGGMEYALAYLVGEGLSMIDVPGNLVPGLAASWKLLDENTWEFTLRQGITFHDGNPLTSEDAAFSIVRYMSPELKTSGGAQLARYVDTVETPDPLRIVIKTKQPDPILARRLEVGAMPISRKYYDKVGDEGFRAQPVAAGPYKFVKQKVANFLEYEAFDAYYEGPPGVKTLVLRIVPEAMTRLAMLKTGEADLIDNVSGPMLSAIEAAPDMRVIASEAAGTCWINPLDMYLEDSPQAELRVRQALAISIDRDAIIKKIFFNQATPMASMLGPALWGHDRSLPVPPYDPEKARQLLKEAGYADGFEVSLHAYQSSATPLIPEMMEAVSAFWAKIGVRCKLDVMEGGTYWGKFREKSMRGFAPLALSENTSDGGLRAVTLAMGGAAYSCINDPELNKMIREQETLMDMKAREELIKKIDRHIMDNWYIIPMVHNDCLYGVRSNVKEWKIRYGNSRLEGLERLTLVH